MMQETLFRKKYLGEVTLKNGEHVKFLYPVSDSEIKMYSIPAKRLWDNIQKHRDYLQAYKWVVLDDLTYDQFVMVYVGMKKYGEIYWKFVWQDYLEKNSKKTVDKNKIV